MTALLNFLGDHWFVSLILGVCVVLPLGCVALWVPVAIVNTLLLVLPSRVMRHWNIRKHGWPPAHCDADGDAREVET